jgi:hypothetical protein
LVNTVFPLQINAELLIDFEIKNVCQSACKEILFFGYHGIFPAGAKTPPADGYSLCGYNRRTSCPLIQDRTAAIPMIPIDAQSEASMPWRNATETPPARFVVPINTSKAILRGIDAEATVIAMIKLPRIPMFWTVLKIPEIPPKEPCGAFAMTALLFDGKNIAEPIPEIPDAIRTTQRGVSS